MKGFVAILAMFVAVMFLFSLVLPVRPGVHLPYTGVVAD
jgi:hypothetical protein